MQAHLEAYSQEYDLVAVFGSYARGEALRKSDYDVFILDDSFSGWSVHESAQPVNFEWPAAFPGLHLICCSHSEFAKRYEAGDRMVEEIHEEGAAIHPQFGLADYFR